MSLTFAEEEYTRIEKICEFNNNALIEDNDVRCLYTNRQSRDNNNSIFSFDDDDANSCVDSSDNSLNVTGEQNRLSHIHASSNDSSSNGPQRQQQKALNLNGNEMRHRKNLLFNLINSIMNYLGTSNRNNESRNESGVGSELIKKDDADDRINMNNVDRCSNNSCDTSNNINNLEESNMEYAFSDENTVKLNDERTEVAMVPKDDSFGVTLR